MNKIGLRSEDKQWESRVSISPEDIPTLPQTITITIQNEVERTISFNPHVLVTQPPNSLVRQLVSKHEFRTNQCTATSNL